MLSADTASIQLVSSHHIVRQLLNLTVIPQICATRAIFRQVLVQLHRGQIGLVDLTPAEAGRLMAYHLLLLFATVPATRADVVKCGSRCVATTKHSLGVLLIWEPVGNVNET